MKGRPNAQKNGAYDVLPTEPIDLATHPIRVAYLEPLGGGDRVRIGVEPLIVGRGSSCALRIEDTRVSGKHAFVQATDQGVRVRDLSSTNGTFVDDRRTDQTWVTRPAVLTFGRTSYRLVLGDLEANSLPSPRSFGDVTGRTPGMLELFAVLERVAPTACPVLLRGEAGTGKERLARAIHAASRRSQGPFVSVHAASLRASGAQALLFGDTRQARAGNEAGSAGLFAQANGGTLFLKEIGELPRGLQAKILDVLETKCVRPAGGKPRPVDVRILAATSSDVDVACRRGTFRQDLLRRVTQVRLQVPPLRERREDIRLLARELCQELHQAVGLPATWLDDDALAALEAHDWPGNVRELKNVLEQALVEAQGAVIQRDRIEHAVRVQQGTASTPAALAVVSSAKDRNKRALHNNLRDLYRHYDGNIMRTANAAGLDRHTVRRKLQEMGVHPTPKEPGGGKG
jgi:DNA-binding NtrC family response regulator